MPSKKPVFTLRTDQVNLDKLKIIAEHENRSQNNQLEYILLNYIKMFEYNNGEIKIESDN